MENLCDKIQRLIELMGFNDFSVSREEENGRFVIFLNEGEWLKRFLPYFVTDLDYIVRLIAKKQGAGPAIIDINNYRRERENLILELARASARKAVAEKAEVRLPAMNAYERRLVHLELSGRPDVSTESIGERKERCVVIKPIN